MKRTATFALAVFAAGGVLLGQDNRITKERVSQTVHAEVGGAIGHAGGFHYISTSGIGGALVKNAPYTADAVSEMTRTLADGNRIVNKSTTNMARDKDGRTRREMNLANVGPFANQGATVPRIVTIHDPVSGEMITLDMNEKTARRFTAGKPFTIRSDNKVPGGGIESREERFEFQIEHKVGAAVPDTPLGDNVMFAPGAVAMAAPVGATFMRFKSENAKSEDLGNQVMEGVNVVGTRETMTIPAGEIGNDRPIISVTERWYSNELQMLIYSKTNDPQSGETIYRVTNLRRDDPSPDLFKVPGDFKVEENRPGVMLRRKLDQAKE